MPRYEEAMIQGSGKFKGPCNRVRKKSKKSEAKEKKTNERRKRREKKKKTFAPFEKKEHVNVQRKSGNVRV